ncbi:MAG: archaeal proteasome endopeptidase complex subunit beta [Candidatus Jordarchaeum sp.]|uniref:archaeal proteasome endopeptidase complex subunit beta n=1 Tax=Candidatus Jordarchaeum sp. TaxID=2823881 RepID=UPI00404B5F79
MSGYPESATIVGIVCKNGVVLAAEKRVTYGRLITSRTGKKVFKITDNIGITVAGLIADMQVLSKELEAMSRMYAMEQRKPINLRAAATLLSNILYERKMAPFFSQTIIGGVDEGGPAIYTLDLLGSLLKDAYAAAGSGSEIALGTLERSYKEGMDINQGKDLAIRAIRAAAKRDVLSGEGIDVMTITNKGIEISEESIT